MRFPSSIPTRSADTFAMSFLIASLHDAICSCAFSVCLSYFSQKAVTSLFAYNAGFDRNHLPELGHFSWFDIMRIAIYRQNNPKIPDWADCFSTGRMKRNYGVEPMLRLLSGNGNYRETHNALFDALDELEIIRLLEKPLRDYIPL